MEAKRLTAFNTHVFGTICRTLRVSDGSLRTTQASDLTILCIGTQWEAVEQWTENI